MDVSILIVAHRTWGHCAEALESLAFHPPRDARGEPMEYEVLVVDTGSPPPPPRVLARIERALTASRGRLIQLEHNVGYGPAANLACHETSGRCVVVSNADVLFREGTVGRLVEFLDRHPDVGAAGPELFWDDALTCRMPDNILPTAAHAIYELAVRASARLERRLASRNVRRQIALWEATGPTDVDTLSGCCLALRRAVIERAGLFDERFTLYLEDADLSKRLERHGLRRVVVKDSKLVHKFSQSFGQDPDASMARYWTSFERYHARWSSWLGIAVAKLYRELTERWRRRLRSSPPSPPWITELESDTKPQLPLRRHCERFCVQISLEPSFQAMVGVFGAGDSWTPHDALFARFPYRTWIRVFDLSDGHPDIVGEFRVTRRTSVRGAVESGD